MGRGIQRTEMRGDISKKKKHNQKNNSELCSTFNIFTHQEKHGLYFYG